MPELMFDAFVMAGRWSPSRLVPALGQTARRLMVALALIGLATGAVRAGPFEDGAAAFQKGDHATALRLLRPIAEQGNVGAQYLVAFAYVGGQGVPQDYGQAAAWFQKAAEQGYAPAQYQLGVIRQRGLAGPEDYPAAVSWYEKAAQQGLSSAQFNLGLLRFAGLGGVPQDVVRGYMWLRIAASARPTPDRVAEDPAIPDKAKQVLQSIAARMKPEQIAEAEGLAREWKPGAPKAGDAQTK